MSSVSAAASSSMKLSQNKLQNIIKNANVILKLLLQNKQFNSVTKKCNDASWKKQMISEAKAMGFSSSDISLMQKQKFPNGCEMIAYMSLFKGKPNWIQILKGYLKESSSNKGFFTKTKEYAYKNQYLLLAGFAVIMFLSLNYNGYLPLFMSDSIYWIFEWLVVPFNYLYSSGVTLSIISIINSLVSWIGYLTFGLVFEKYYKPWAHSDINKQIQQQDQKIRLLQLRQQGGTKNSIISTRSTARPTTKTTTNRVTSTKTTTTNRVPSTKTTTISNNSKPESISSSSKNVRFSQDLVSIKNIQRRSKSPHLRTDSKTNTTNTKTNTRTNTTNNTTNTTNTTNATNTTNTLNPRTDPRTDTRTNSKTYTTNTTGATTMQNVPPNVTQTIGTTVSTLQKTPNATKAQSIKPLQQLSNNTTQQPPQQQLIDDYYYTINVNKPKRVRYGSIRSSNNRNNIASSSRNRMTNSRRSRY